MIIIINIIINFNVEEEEKNFIFQIEKNEQKFQFLLLLSGYLLASLCSDIILLLFKFSAFYCNFIE